jgi:hypothetical protein
VRVYFGRQATNRIEVTRVWFLVHFVCSVLSGLVYEYIFDSKLRKDAVRQGESSFLFVCLFFWSCLMLLPSRGVDLYAAHSGRA